MKKFKRSFIEVIAGRPTKEHYINVIVAVVAIAVVAGILVSMLFTFFKVQ